ncbi:hypothetical protein ACFFX1_01010 [Dactylosporangium sucinum]|uniref:Uncharacterized protein n=1 Tax=Dactylosporangium sucinum TaxID=1424081 RepID=A0A917TG05_9ACTN|nr:hypothetical protein [Dactylosporangium sucinum]GGM22131.1 hypothetical protein GCM10007977_024110 [Dactylosporangium sucinum]
MADPLLLTTSRHDAAGVVDRLLATVRGGSWPHGAPYRHVNGFTKIVAARYPDGSRLTLHYWPAARGEAPDVSRPHDHRFPFTSVLLGGRQHFVELEECPAGGEAWTRFTYRPYLGGRVALVARTGDTRLVEVRVVRRRPLAGTYGTTSTVIHQAVTDRQEPCATLVLRGPREKVRSQVYYRPGEPPPRGGLQFGRRLERGEVLRQLADVAAMVG